MPVRDEKPPARPVFRKLAIGVAVVCFILAVVFVFAPIEEKAFPVVVYLFVGFVMAVLGLTGHWPPARSLGRSLVGRVPPVISGLVFVGALVFVVLMAIQGYWEWLVPSLFPGAVEQGLVARTIPWRSGLAILLVLVLLAGLFRISVAPVHAGASPRSLDAKLNAIIKHLGIDLPLAIRDELTALVRSGKKIEAIELYRSCTGVGLAEAKAYVEGLERST